MLWPCDQPSHSQSYRQYRSVRLGKYSCGSILVYVCDFISVLWIWFGGLGCFCMILLGHSGWGVEGWVKFSFHTFDLTRYIIKPGWMLYGTPSPSGDLGGKSSQIVAFVGPSAGTETISTRGRGGLKYQKYQKSRKLHVDACTVSMYCSCMVSSWPHKACWWNHPEDGEDRIFGSKELGKTLVLAADLGAEKQLQQDAWKNTLETRKDVGRWWTQQIEFNSLEMNTANSWNLVLLLFTFTAVGPRMRCFIWPKWGN